MKRLLVIVVLMVGLRMTCAFATDGTEIHNGVTLGMRPSEVLALEQENEGFYNSREYLEGMLLGQPYTLIFFNYADADTEASHFEAYGEAMVEYANGELVDYELHVDYSLRGMSLNLTLNWLDNNPFDPYGVHTEYVVKDEDNDRYLVQVHAIFTSDQYYKTAVETFEDVEDQLEAVYGVTRYTTRRGESLPLYKGWLRNTTAMTVMPVHELEPVGYSVPQYTHRVVRVADGNYMVVDHHILIYETEEKATFSHEIVYTLIPWDISGGYAVDCTR